MAQELRQCSSLHGKQPWIEGDLMKLMSETQPLKYQKAVARIVLSEDGEYFLDDGFQRIPAILDSSSNANFIHGGCELQLYRLEKGMAICVLDHSYIIRLKDGAFKFFMCVNNWEHVPFSLPGNSDHLTDINTLETAKNLLQNLIFNALQDMDSSSQMLLSQFPEDSQTLSNLVRIANEAISFSQSQQNCQPLEASANQSKSAQLKDVLSRNNSLNKVKTARHPNQDHKLSEMSHTADASHDRSLEEPFPLESQQNNRTFIDSVTDQDVSPTQLLEMMVLEAEQNYGLHKCDQEKIIYPGIFEDKDPMETLKSAVSSSGKACELTTPTFQDLLVPSDQRRSLAQIQGWSLSDDSSRDSSSLPAFLLQSFRNSNSSSLGNLFLQPTVKDYTKHNQAMPKNCPAFNHLSPGLMKENCLESSENIINDKLLSHNFPVELTKENRVVGNDTGTSGKFSSEHLSLELVKENCNEKDISGKFSLSCDGQSGAENEQSKNSSSSLFSDADHESSSLAFNLEFCNKPKESLTLLQQNDSSFPCSSKSNESGKIHQILESNESDKIHQILESNESGKIHQILESNESGKIHQILESNESGKIHQILESNESNNSIQSCDGVTRVYSNVTSEPLQFSESDISQVKTVGCLIPEVLSTQCEQHLKLFEDQSNKCENLEILNNTAQTTTTSQGNVRYIDQTSSGDFTLDNQTDTSLTSLEAKPKHESVDMYEEATVVLNVIDLSSTDDIYMLDGIVNDSLSESLTSSSDPEITSPFRSYKMEHYSPQAVHFESADKGTTDNMVCLANSFNKQDLTSSLPLIKSSVGISTSESTISDKQGQTNCTKTPDLFHLDSVTWHTGSEQIKDDASYNFSQNNTNTVKLGNISHKSKTDEVIKITLQNIATTINKFVDIKTHVALPTQESKLGNIPVTLEMSKIAKESHLPLVEGTRKDKQIFPLHNYVIPSKRNSLSSSKLSGCAHEHITKELRVLLTDIMKRKIEEPPSTYQPLMKEARILVSDIMKNKTNLFSNGQINLSNTTSHSPDQCSTTKKHKNQQTTPDVNWTVQEKNQNENGARSYQTRTRCKLQKYGQSVMDLPKKHLRVSVIDIGKHNYNIMEIRRLSQQSPASSLRCTSSAQHHSKLGGNVHSREQFTRIKEKYPVKMRHMQTRSQICPGSEKDMRARVCGNSQSEIPRQGRRQSRRILTNEAAKMTSCEYYGQNDMWTSTPLSEYVTSASTSLFNMTASYSTSDWRNVTPVITSSSELETQQEARLPPASFMCSPAIGSQGLVSPAIDSQGLVSLAIDSQGLVSPAIDNQGLVSPAIDSQGLVSPAIDSQGLVSPAIDSQGLVSPTIDSQGLVSRSKGLVSPAIDSQSLVSPAIYSQGLVSPAIYSQGLVSLAIDSKVLVSPTIDSQGLVSPTIDSQGLVSPTIDSQGLVSPAIGSQGLVSQSHNNGTRDQSVSLAFICETEAVTDNSEHLYAHERLEQSIASLVSYISSGKLL